MESYIASLKTTNGKLELDLKSARGVETEAFGIAKKEFEQKEESSKHEVADLKE